MPLSLLQKSEKQTNFAVSKKLTAKFKKTCKLVE